MRLSYCTNVHPAEDLAGILEQLDTHAREVRELAGLDLLGVGLWLPSAAADLLAQDRPARAALGRALQRNGLELTTVNAFPAAAFHADVVKLAVYEPDWTDPSRLAHTINCATVLADLAPAGIKPSISTLPLGWRDGWGPEQDAVATAAFATLNEELAKIRDRTGVTVRVGIEPEPGCVLDNVADILAWLGARPELVEPGFLGICLDTCHLGVSFADPEDTVLAIGASGIPVVKVQASAALELTAPAQPGADAAVAEFAEARYLHQVRCRRPDGSIAAADDLVDVLKDPAGWHRDGPWRMHVHVPLHHRPQAPLRSTTEVLTRALDAVLGLPGGIDAQLDIETYGWSVLPEQWRPEGVAAGVAAEVRWAIETLGHALVDSAVQPAAPVIPASRTPIKETTAVAGGLL